MVTLEELVPQHHLVRKVDAAIDFEFIRDAVAHLYCPDNGRPAVDPVRLIKMMLPGGRVLYTDSTHLKASANPRKAKNIPQPVKASAYIDSLNAAIDEDRAAAGKKPLTPATTAKMKDTKVSTTDPESGFMHRDNKPKGFFWLDHRTEDDKYGIITDTYTTPRNVHDSQPYIARLERQLSRFKLNPIAVGLDTGYFTAPVCHMTEQIDIIAVMGYRWPNKGQNVLQKNTSFTMINRMFINAHKGSNLSTKPQAGKAIGTITLHLKSVGNART